MNAAKGLAYLLLLFAASKGWAGQEAETVLDHAYWIWWDKDTNAIRPPYQRSEYSFTKEFDVQGAVKTATLRVTAESVYKLFVNDREVGGDDKWITLDTYDIKPFLVAGKNRILIKARTTTWFAGLFVVGAIEEADGKTLTIISDRSWDCSSDADNKVKKAEEVIQGVNGGWWNNCNRLMVMPDCWYRLGTELVTPSIPWAKPYAGGKVRVLAIQPRATQRDTAELLQRADVDVTVVFTDLHEAPDEYGGQRAPFFPITKGLRRADIVDDLARALANRWDVIILGGLDEKLFYDVLAAKLKEMVGNGTGLVYTAIPPRMIPKEGQKQAIADPSYEKELTATPVAALPESLLTGIPFESLPGFRVGPQDKDRDFRKVAALFQYGKGRIARLAIAGGWGLFANAPDRNDLHYEYYQSFAIKTLLWAAGKEPTVLFRNFPAVLEANHAPGGSGELAFSLSGKGAYTVSLAIRSPEKLYALPVRPVARPGVEQGATLLRPIYEAKTDVHVGDSTPVKFALPALPAGRYFLDVLVSDGAAKHNWATAALAVTSPLAIKEVKLEPPFINVAGGKPAQLKATAVLSNPAPARAGVRFSLLDNYDRLVQNADVPGKEGAVAVEVVFTVKTFATTLGKVRAELTVAGDKVDIAIGRFTAVRRDWDRFLFVGWAQFPGDHSGNIYARVLANLGFDACRGQRVTLDTLEAADVVALPGYAGLPRRAFDITPEEQKRADQATAALKEQLPFDPVAYYCGDEIDYGGGDELPGRIIEFRKFLQARYKTIAALNKQWDTNYASFDEIYPIARKETLADSEKGKLILQKDYFEQVKATGNYSRWLDQWLSNYKAFADMARNPRRVIKSFDPHARVGVDCPMWPMAYSGHDWYTFLQEFEMFAPYGREGEIQPYEDARSFARPGTLLGLEYGGYLYLAFVRREQLTDVEWHHWRVWHGLLRGFTSTWWYNLFPGANEGSIGPGLVPVPTLEQYGRDLDTIRSGFYTLYTRAKRHYGPVAMHYSVPSRLMTAVLPDMGSDRAFTVHMTMRIMNEIVGQPFTFVANERIKTGGLKDYKVLIMPSSLAIGETEAKELEKFVEAGGILIADVRPGIADESGRVGNNAIMSQLFGLAWKKELGRTMLTAQVSGTYKGVPFRSIVQKFPADPAVVLSGAKPACEVEGIPLVTWNDVGKGTAICLNIPFNYYRGYPTPDHLYGYYGDWDHNRMIGSILTAIFKAHKIARPVQVDVPGAGWLSGLDVAFHTDGKVQYVGLTKKRMAKSEGESEVTVHAPAPGEVYDMLNGKYIGSEGAWKVKLAGADVQLFSILPCRVEDLRVSLKDRSVRPGDEIAGKVRVETSRGSPGRHIIHLEVVRPTGEAVRYLARNLEAIGGSARFSLPICLNEPVGTWELRFTDVASGVKRSALVEVK